MMYAGYCTKSGTEAFYSRQHISTKFRQTRSKLKLSSIGVGTYLGNETDETDREVVDAIYAMLKNGCNLIDTAPNYRNGRAERTVGQALHQAITDGIIRRDEVFICSKVGILPNFLLNKQGCNDSYSFINGSIYDNCFCFEPAYVEWQIQASLKLMQLETVDCLFLHNIEAFKQSLGKQIFLNRLGEIICLLEKMTYQGYIRAYGISSWDAFRVLPENPLHIDLLDIFNYLNSRGIKYNNFKFLQLPLGIWGTEAFSIRTQRMSSSSPVSVLHYALDRDISVLANSALLQGDLLRCDLSVIPGSCSLSATQQAINFARSIPGITSLLVGIKAKKSIGDIIQVLNSEYFDFTDMN